MKVVNGEYITSIICESAEREDTAEYTITVNNDHGSDSTQIKLVVLGQFRRVIPYLDAFFYVR